MNKFTNCIYILSHETAFTVNNKKSYKIGSTKNLPERMLTYKTYYPIDKIVICYFYIKNYDCYKLDNDIKIHFYDDNVKNNGGIEFYYNITIKKITKYFDDCNIEYELYLDNDYILETLFNKYKLKEWQIDLVNKFNNFIKSNNNTGIIIAPTGCGKSFMMSYLSIFEYNKDVLIMTKRKEILDSEFINKTNEMIIESKKILKYII